MPIMTSPTNNETQSPNFFYHCKLENLPSLLRVWTPL